MNFFPRLRLSTVAVFAATLAGYAWTLAPTLPGGDAGELAAVANAAAVAHPPGYPLYTMLGWLLARMPVGSVAWRVAWLSAIPAAGAAALLFATASRAARLLLAQGDGPGKVAGGSAATGDDAVAFASGAVAAGLFAWSPSTWAYATGPEVFALHLFFVALLSFLALRWLETRDPRVATAIALATGLGLSNHHTTVLHAAPIAAWLLWTGRKSLWTPTRLATLAAAGLAGLLPYAYLLVAGLGEHPLSWGDTATVSGFLDHLLRRDYGTFQLIPGGHLGSPLPAKLAAWAAHFARETLGAGAVLAMASVAHAALARPRAGAARSWTLLMLACAATHLLVFLWRANVPLEDPLLVAVLTRFWLQADLVACLLAGTGVAVLATLAGRWSARAPGIAIAAAALLLVAMRAGASAPERIRRGEAVVERYGRALLEPLPERTLLLTSGDLVTNAVRYLQSAEGLRPDVLVLDQEMMTKRWYVSHMKSASPGVVFPGDFYHPREPGGFSMRSFLDANAGTRPVFLYPEWKQGDPSLAGAWRAWPEGLASRVAPARHPPDPAAWSRASAVAVEALDARGWPAPHAEPPGSWERIVLEDVWMAHHRRAHVLLEEAIARDNDAALLDEARAGFEDAIARRDDAPWFAWKNLGIALDRLAAARPGGGAPAAARELEAWRRYLAMAPANDAGRGEVEQLVRALENGQAR